MIASQKCFFTYTRYAVQAACELYDRLTEKVPLDDKDIVWGRYNQRVNEDLLAPILEWLHINGVTINELCLLALKLTEVGGVSYAMAKGVHEEEDDPGKGGAYTC
jgi:transcriptional accessory protein Tex/SPT6